MSTVRFLQLPLLPLYRLLQAFADLFKEANENLSLILLILAASLMLFTSLVIAFLDDVVVTTWFFESLMTMMSGVPEIIISSRVDADVKFGVLFVDLDSLI